MFDLTLFNLVLWESPRQYARIINVWVCAENLSAFFSNRIYYLKKIHKGTLEITSVENIKFNLLKYPEIPQEQLNQWSYFRLSQQLCNKQPRAALIINVIRQGNFFDNIYR